MGRILLLISLALFCQMTWASEESNKLAVQNCLKSWKNPPFSKTDPKYKVLSAKVKVLGIGGNISDTEATTKPELVLVKANVSVLSSTDITLMNPNGWYCLKGKVAVLGKTTIKLNCKAQLASSKDGTTVLGGADKSDGVTVLGSSRIEKVCD